MNIIDYIFHKLLRRPYRLVKTYDTEQGKPIVLLHGLASSSKIWNPLVTTSDLAEYRIVTFDLLGFGLSPKPHWVSYTVEEHAKSVVSSIRKLKLHEPIILVGHSMGCLIAAHIAYRYPDLVQKLVLFEPPLLPDIPELKRYSRRRKIHMRAFGYVVSRQELVVKYSRYIGKWANRLSAFALDEEGWVPFERSLRNTIMQQNAYEELKHIKIPTEIIYGRNDVIVIRSGAKKLFSHNPNITLHTIKEGHGLSKRSSIFLKKIITT